MDENNNQTQNSGEGSKSSTGMIIGVVAAVAVVGLIALWFINRSSIDQLTRQVTNTQDQVQDVQSEANKAQENVGEAIKEGVEDVANSIGDINNPVVRLALAKAYVAKLQSTLDAKSKEDLNVVLVYVQRQPTVLVKPPATWPADVQQALTNLKTKLANAKASVATFMADAKETVQYKVNDLLTLTGTLEFVSDDSVLGGSVFMLTETGTGKKYYFEFNQANSEQIKSTMVGKEVSIKVKITGIEGGNVTFDVVSGPTLVVATVTPVPTTATSSGEMSQ